MSKKKKSPIIKPPRISNLALMQEAINKLQEETGFHFKNIKFGNGYFIFSYEKNTVCHFEIQEIPGFLFGLWNTKNVDLNYYEPNYKGAELILFSQAKITLDKFKPSNSCLRAPLSRYTYLIKNENEDFDWSLYEAVNLLKFIKKHRLKAYYRSDFSDWCSYNTASNFEIIRDYLSIRFTKLRKFICSYIKRKWLSFQLFSIFNRFNVRAILVDQGDCWSPRLDLNILPYEDTTPEEYDIIDAVIDDIYEKHINDVTIFFDYYSKEYRKRYFNWVKHVRKLEKDKEEDYKILWEKI